MDTLDLTPIGHIHTDFSDKFGIPRQSGMAETSRAYITFEGECANRDCFRGIEEYSHLWLIWGFSGNPDRWSPTVRPPRLGGNQRKGVFATRSPFRPNPLGLSSVRLERVVEDAPEGPVLWVLGADLMDGTPIYDIKPYLAFTDSHPEAEGSFTDAALEHRLQVQCPDEWLRQIPERKQKALLDALALDPRPSYQNDSERVYGMEYSGYNVRFRVQGQELVIVEIQCLKEKPKEG